MAYCERRSLWLVPAPRVWTVRVTIVGRISFLAILLVDLGALRSGDTYIIIGHCEGRRVESSAQSVWRRSKSLEVTQGSLKQYKAIATL